jgi:hypothetical protein
MAAQVTTPATPPPPPSGESPKPTWRESAALALVVRRRADALELDPKTLSRGDLLFAFGLVTKLKNFADRRLTAIRTEVDALFTGELELKATDLMQTFAERVFFGPHDRGDLTGKVIAAKLLNGSYGKKALSETKALDLLATKKRSAKRMAMEKPPRPPQPLPRFSAEKFRGLIAKGIITQAEYDACFDARPPRPTMTVEVPPELEAAIVETLLRPPGGP